MDVSSPPITVIAIGVRISEPSPSPSAIGVSPSTVVRVVIMMGLSRRLAASRIASSRSRPCSLNWLIRSTSTMALLTTMPASMMRPMNTITLSRVSVSHSATATPTAASGMENRMTKGCSRDSNCEAMTRYTRKTARPSANMRDRNDASISSLWPEILGADSPGRTGTSASRARASSTALPRSP